MQRRDFLKRAATLGGATSIMPFALHANTLTTIPSSASLKKSPRMPVLFVGHGSPMNAIDDNAWRQSWQALGREFGVNYPTPQLVLCISAHWLTTGWQITAMAQPKTIHDFGGFPQALFDQQYAAPGAPAAAKEISLSISAPKIALDHQEWGLDHGTWSILKPMFPSATIPVLQLSMDYIRPAAEHAALGAQLARLRDYGVLIVGSGNIVHNLRTMKRDAAPNETFSWAAEFDQTIATYIEQNKLAELSNFQALGQTAKLAHPTHEHYLPLLYAAGATNNSDTPRFFNANFQGASISMRSVVWS
jgi:4,5-DOPA dioxygenase extradiol